MAVSTYQLEVITPQGAVYAGSVTHSRVPVQSGFVGVLANHAPYITSSPGGSLEVREAGGEEKKFEVGTGFFEVRGNQATFLTQSFNPEPSPSK